MADFNRLNLPILLETIAFNVGTLRAARKKISAQLAPDFNLFNFLRHDEMGLSSAIANLLDPKGSHGQGRVLLECLVKRLGSDYSWIAAADDWRVFTEKTSTEQRRLDIYLESQHGLVAIENKPWAIDQDKQLEDYAKFLEKTCPKPGKWLLIYLGNGEPSEASITKDRVQVLEGESHLRQIDFHFLAKWLDECATLAKALVVRVFIEELAKFVRIKVNGEMVMSEQNEVIEKIRTSPHGIEGSFHIFNSMNALKQELLNKFHQDLKNACATEKYQVVWDENSMTGKRYSGFGVKFDATHRLYLRIEFAGVNLESADWGIFKTDEKVVKDDALWKKISAKMSIFGRGNVSDWWPWFSALDSRPEFGENFKDWNRSPTPWIEIENGQLVNRVINLANAVKQALSDAGSLDYLK